jgi:hypothetical protein
MEEKVFNMVYLSPKGLTEIVSVGLFIEQE